MDAEQLRKRKAYFEGKLGPVRSFEQANVKPIIKALEANVAETVARMYGSWYPRIEDL